MLNLLHKRIIMKEFYCKKPIFALLVLLLASFSNTLQLQAQVFPTSATVRLVPPYNTFLSELSQGNSDKVQVILLQRDQSVPNYDVRLKFKVKLAGNVIFETAPSFVSPIINLEQNTPIVLSGADLAAYFQANHLVFANANLRNIYVNNGQVPEGLYEFCATVYSATRADRQLSNNACQIFSLSRSLPPLLNLPACGGAIPEQNPLNLRFWWTPQHSSSVNSAANTSYVLEIFEIRNADGNANNAVLTSSPVFSFPTPLTQYFYSISDPNFIVGMRYAWRVRVIDDSNRDAFINNGYSAVCEFTYAPTLANGQTLVPILAPSNIQAEGKGIRAGRVYWSAFVGTALDRPDRYKVEYKKVGASGNAGLEWFSEFTTTDELLINQGLEPATTYEARVQGEKGGFLGDASSIVTFTTFIPVTPVCGVTPTNVLENMTPMRNARIGMPIEVTGFEVVLDSLEAESTPGVYSGRGLIKIPFMLNQTFTVLFESLFINELGQAGEGRVWFKTKPIEEWIADQAGQTAANQQEAQDILNNQQAFADTPFYDDVITFGNTTIQSISVSPQGYIQLNTAGGTFMADTALVPKPPRRSALIIEDKDGNQWVILPNNSVVAAPHGGLPPKYNYSDDKLDATDSLRVDFTQKLLPSPQLFGFDARRKGNTYFKWAKNFEAIRLKGGLPYFVPYQSLGAATLTATSTQREEVVVNIKYLPKATEPAFNESSLTFKLGTTVITAKTATATTTGYTASFLFNLPAVPITGTSGDEPFLYAYYGTKKIGKINIAPFKRREEKVILVPVNGATAPNVGILQTYLDSVYRQANVKFTVTEKTGFRFNIDSVGAAGLARAGSGINKYSAEMRMIRDKFAIDTTYDKKASYIFVVSAFEGGGLDGFMVRGRSMGFVASGANKRTYAHELGHGAFGLEHTFPEIGQSLSNNLMDYGDSTHLTHKQCKDIAKRKFVFNWLDSEEDGSVANFVVGAITGGVVDLLIQVGEIYIDKGGVPSFAVIVSEISWSSVALSVVFGGASSGAGAITKFKAFAQTPAARKVLENGLELILDCTEDVIKDYAKGDVNVAKSIATSLISSSLFKLGGGILDALIPKIRKRFGILEPKIVARTAPKLVDAAVSLLKEREKILTDFKAKFSDKYYADAATKLVDDAYLQKRVFKMFNDDIGKWMRDADLINTLLVLLPARYYYPLSMKIGSTEYNDAIGGTIEGFKAFLSSLVAPCQNFNAIILKAHNAGMPQIQVDNAIAKLCTITPASTRISINTKLGSSSYTNAEVRAFLVDVLGNGVDPAQALSNNILQINSNIIDAWQLVRQARCVNSQVSCDAKMPQDFEILKEVANLQNNTTFLSNLGVIAGADGKESLKLFIKKHSTARCYTCGSSATDTHLHYMSAYLIDLVYFVNNFHTTTDVQSVWNQGLTGSPTQVVGGAYMLYLLNQEKNLTLPANEVLRFELDLNNSPNLAKPKKADIVLSNSSSTQILVECKSWTHQDPNFSGLRSGSSASYSQFETYLKNISSMNELRYYFDARRTNITETYVKDVFKTSFTNNQPAIFDAIWNNNLGLRQSLFPINNTNALKNNAQSEFTQMINTMDNDLFKFLNVK